MENLQIDTALKELAEKEKIIKVLNRELEIEAALEKVRSMTMIMQKSSDLRDVISVLTDQFLQLGIKVHSANFNTSYREKDWNLWLYNPGVPLYPDQIHLPYLDHPFFNRLLGLGEKEADFDIYVSTKEDKDTFLDHFYAHTTGWEHLKERQHFVYDKPGMAWSIAFSKNTAVTIVNYDIEPFTEEENRILRRFANVFEQSYTRFIDLKNAEAQAKEIEKAYLELKTTQGQLIHQEKMASLGELTAGIAHEIQNPLNFVNNFSEVSVELLGEMKIELERGEADEAKLIAKDVIQSLEKIVYHGKRAESIVKGMLEHSRTGSGEKEATDINALADEYLRLSYHGFRAKNKAFNADFKTDFDERIGKIQIVPREMGRVLLNLINNAFYAVGERSKQGQADYNPLVVVKTQKTNGIVEISVSDNGMGIPRKLLDKIFQPFFTTKPTGQGTGLGLSLSYDIVTKGHGGALKVKTVDEPVGRGQGSVFTIELPVQKD